MLSKSLLYRLISTSSVLKSSLKIEAVLHKEAAFIGEIRGAADPQLMIEPILQVELIGLGAVDNLHQFGWEVVGKARAQPPDAKQVTVVTR